MPRHQDFKKDEFILHITGRETKTRHPSKYSKSVQKHWFPIAKKRIYYSYVLPEFPWKYINHSCEPSVGIKNNRDVVAMRTIRRGEELTFDYATNNIDNWTMICTCGSKKCRKVISTFDKLNKNAKKRYKNYLTDYIREQYGSQTN